MDTCFFVKLEQSKNGNIVGRSILAANYQTKEEAEKAAKEHLAEAFEAGIEETYQVIKPLSLDNLFILGGKYYEVV